MKKINLLTIVILLSSLCIAYLVTLLPDGNVPLHLNINGEVDRYGSRWFVLLGPIIATVLAVLIQIYLRNTKNKSMEALQIMMSIILVIILGVCWLPYVIAISTNPKNIVIFIGIFLGIMFIFIGNYTGLLKTNTVVGIRVKWTFADEEVWQKTHRLAGYLFVLLGMVILMSTFIGFVFNIKLIAISVLTFTIAIVLIATLYSYVLYRRKCNKMPVE
jgi:uncharacterized membrane protein